MRRIRVPALQHLARNYSDDPNIVRRNVIRSCTHKRDSQMVADVIQASKLWELEDGTIRSDGF